MEILTLGEKIKQKRKEQDMTLKDLAGDRVTPGQISLVESGKSKPSIDLLEYISEKLKVSIDHILETEEHQAEKLCQYYSKIAEASLLAGNYEQTRAAISMGIDYAERYNLKYYIGLNELYTGKMEYGQDNYKNAQSRFLSANEIFLNVGSVRDIIDTYINLGMTTYKLQYYNSSLNFYNQAEKIISNNEIIDDDMLMRIYYNISICYSSLGKYNESIDYALLAMEKLKQKDDKFQYGQSLLMLSISYSSLDNFDEALFYCDRALMVFKDLDNLTFVAKMETNMGSILTDIGNIEESFKHLHNAYKIKLETKDKTLIQTMLKIADNYIKVNDTNNALKTVWEAYETCNDLGYKEYMGDVYVYLHKLYIAEGDNKNAELYLLEAIKFLQNMDMPDKTANIYILLGEFYESMGNTKEALKFLNMGVKTFKDIGLISNS